MEILIILVFILMGFIHKKYVKLTCKRRNESVKNIQEKGLKKKEENIDL